MSVIGTRFNWKLQGAEIILMTNGGGELYQRHIPYKQNILLSIRMNLNPYFMSHASEIPTKPFKGMHTDGLVSIFLS